MHILFVSEYYPPKVMGGGEINLSLLAQNLAQQGHTIYILTSKWKDLPKIEQQGNIAIHRTLTTGANPSSLMSNLKRSIHLERSVIQEVTSLIQSKTIDLIHFTGISIIAAPHLKKLGKPLFATIESYPALCPKGDRLYHGNSECTISCTLFKFITCQHNSSEIGKMKNKIYLKKNPLFLSYAYHHYQKLKKALPHCQLIAISSYVQTLLQKQGVSSTVIPNSLDLTPFLKSEKNKRVTKNSKIKILYLGSFLKSKGLHILLEALQNTDFHCDLYGSGPLELELKEYIQKYNLDATIHAPVPYDKIPTLYQDADIVIFPSIWPEPFGRIAIEAIASGTYLIASNIGGITETLKDHQNDHQALLVPPGNASALHQALNQARITLKTKKNSKSNQEIKKQRSKLIVTLQEQYTPEKIAAQHLNIYQNITTGK